MLSGNAIQNAPSATIFPQSERSTDFRADGNKDNVRNPTSSRMKVTPPGPIAPRASAMNRYDAPQIKPGSDRITHSAAPERSRDREVIALASLAIRDLMLIRIGSALTQAKSHFGYLG